MLVIRDPLHNNIRLDPLARELIETPAFQRLRYVRQLGLAFLVYPGATHTRFEHALGTYHLARRSLGLLGEEGDLSRLPADECAIVTAAALLHDLGHYPFSHALEEIGAMHHEEVARALIAEGEIGEILKRTLGPDAPARIIALVRGESRSPLQRLISGSLDLDKLDYLRRDALMCGVSYGDIDVDRLINSLVLVDDPESGGLTVAIAEKGLSALESLLFAKYQMYRNVYWHHAIRSATAMYKRLVAEALDAGALPADRLASFTDEGLLHVLEEAGLPMLAALRGRKLYKRAFECPAADLDRETAEWIADDPALTMEVEDALATELGLSAGDLLLDYPTKTQMLGLDIPVRRRDGSIRRLTAAGWEGSINLPKLSEELYHSARWLRVFTKERMQLDRRKVVGLAALPGDEVRARLNRGALLLSS
ncbi:MAG TPA: HD domain-containing protein [Gemmatimonadaceae bacterium]|nr:HD domain-containing protein [Gemmatimonadaceae bacterium]